MRLTDDEVEEWHKIVLNQRNQYKRLLMDILTGVPTSGMACPYRQLTLAEIKKAAREAFGFTLFLLLLASPLQASVVKVTQDAKGWRLMVDGSSYVVRGVSYGPEVPGEDPNKGNYRDWMVVDDNKNQLIDGPYDQGDFAAMRDMGVNTIRVYHHPSDNPAIKAFYAPGTEGDLVWNHPPNKAMLRDLFYTYGIRTAMGDEIGAYTTCSSATWTAGTDYTNQTQLKNMELCVRQMVADFKDEPWLLMYILGNENNYEFTKTNANLYPGQYAAFVDKMAVLIHQLDPNHPVAVAMGETQLLPVLASSAPHVDIFGVNSYRPQGYGDLFTNVASVYGKPVLFTEYGVASPVGNEPSDAHELRLEWCDIENHTRDMEKNSLGGFMFGWSDSQWQPHPHNLRGIVDNSRRRKKSYAMFKSLWTSSERCPADAALREARF